MLLIGWRRGHFSLAISYGYMVFDLERKATLKGKSEEELLPVKMVGVRYHCRRRSGISSRVLAISPAGGSVSNEEVCLSRSLISTSEAL